MLTPGQVSVCFFRVVVVGGGRAGEHVAATASAVAAVRRWTGGSNARMLFFQSHCVSQILLDHNLSVYTGARRTWRRALPPSWRTKRPSARRSCCAPALRAGSQGSSTLEAARSSWFGAVVTVACRDGAGLQVHFERARCNTQSPEQGEEGETPSAITQSAPIHHISKNRQQQKVTTVHTQCTSSDQNLLCADTESA